MNLCLASGGKSARSSGTRQVFQPPFPVSQKALPPFPNDIGMNPQPSGNFSVGNPSSRHQDRLSPQYLTVGQRITPRYLLKLSFFFSR